MPLFEVAIIVKPTKKQAEDGVGESLAYGPKPVIARDAQSAAVTAVMAGDVPTDIDRQRMEVLVRPFA